MCSITIDVVVDMDDIVVYNIDDFIVSKFIITCVVLICYLCHCDIYSHYSTIYYCHHSLHYHHSNDHHSFITLMNSSPLLSIANTLSHQPMKVYKNIATPISAITLSSSALSIVVEMILLYITQSIIIMIILIID